MAKALWQQPAPVGEKKEAEPQSAEAVAERTREFLDSQGWCLWECSNLGGEVIAVVRDDLVGGVPKGYPVYTEAELEELCRSDASAATRCLVNEAKKLAGAKVRSEIAGSGK